MLRQPVLPGQSPVVDEALNCIRAEQQKKYHRIRAILCFAVALYAFIEIQYENLQEILRSQFDFEMIHMDKLPWLVLVCSVYGLLMAIHHLYATSVRVPSMVLSPLQWKKMGLKKMGLKPVEPPIGLTSTPASSQTINKVTPFGKSLLRQNGRETSPISSSASPSSPGSPSSSPGGEGASFYPSHSFNLHSFNSSSMSRHKTSPLKTSSVSFHDGSFLDASSSSLRHRRSPPSNSPLSKSNYMTSRKQVESYLEAHNKAKLRTQQLEQAVSGSPWSKAWTSPTLAHDWSNELRENTYQLSTLPPKSTTTSSAKNKDDTTKQAVSEYWAEVDVDSAALALYTGRIRRFMADILQQVMKEVDKCNKRLVEIGCQDFQIGKSSLQALRQLQSTHAVKIPRLTTVLMYLDMSANQEYLVARIKELAGCGYISSFIWNRGGTFKGRAWTDELPVDTDIILHWFKVYMNLHTPLDPRYPDGKTFSSLYFATTPEEKKAMPPASCFIYKVKPTPPVYQVISDAITYDIPEGRDSIFHTLIVFLHIIKNKESGMFGPVKLETLGLDFFLPAGEDQRDLK